MATISEALQIALQHHRAGRAPQAEQVCRQILAADPRQAEALHLLGVLACQAGNPRSAADWIQRAIDASGEQARYHNTLGIVFRALGRLAEAAACYRHALQLEPDAAGPHSNLGNVLKDLGQPAEAEVCYRRALELKPDFAEAHYGLGIALKDQGRHAEAIACYRQVVQHRPVWAEAWNDLGVALRAAGQADEAMACYRQALRLQPGAADVYYNIGNLLRGRAQLDQAIDWYQQALQRDPGHADARSNLLSALHYRPGIGPRELAEAHAEFERRHGVPLRAACRPHDTPPDPQRRLRLGFVSADLGSHPVGHFLIRVLENLDPADALAICYSDRQEADQLTARFQAAATEWREARPLDDERLAEQIRADRIDILFDLAGHTAGNRLRVFARKPAPIQISWIGYVGTTGLSAMDYVLADRYHVPAGAETHYSERVMRMPDGYVCFDPPTDSPAVGPLPAAHQGFVTFASFNNPAKLHPRVAQLWAEVLKRVPASRLVLKYTGIDDPLVERRCRELLAGVTPERVAIQSGSPRHALLEQYNQVDLALDPFPYSGGLTTCEALWMGVPVVTCPGETFASRHALSHLSNVGLTETIARDLGEYVEIAVRLALDKPRLANIRASLRQRVAESPLCDGKRFAAFFADLLRGLWREWCQSRQGQ